jgi:hypothetical protein
MNASIAQWNQKVIADADPTQVLQHQALILRTAILCHDWKI